MRQTNVSRKPPDRRGDLTRVVALQRAIDAGKVVLISEHRRKT